MECTEQFPKALIRLVTGPPCSGKTSAALNEYRACVEAHGHDAALYLVPTQRVADLIRGRVVAFGPQCKGISGLFDFRVMTFADLADVLLIANHASVSAVSEPQRVAILRHVVTRTSSEELGALANHTHRAGLIAAVAETINELKAAGERPEEFERQAALLDDGGLASALAALYSQYDKLLKELELYDEPGKLWAAEELLAAARSRPFGGRIRLVIADGFSDFTTMQLRVLAPLIGLAGRGIITLTYERSDDRPELQGIPERTLEALKQHLERVGEVRIEELKCGEEPQTNLDYVRHYLFSPQAPPRQRKDGSVVVLQAPGPWAEVRLVAREIKKLLACGTSYGPVSPGDVGIIVRTLDHYEEPIREIFAQYGISVFVSRGEPLAVRPPVRFVLDLLSLVSEDFPRAGTLTVWDSTYVCMDRLAGSSVRAASAAEADEVTRLAGVVGGLENWRSSLDRLSERLQSRLELLKEEGQEAPDDHEDMDFETPGKIEALADEAARVKTTFESLVARLGPLMQATTKSGLVEALFSVLHCLGVHENILWAGPREHSAADLRAWNRFLETLRGLADIDRFLGAEDIDVVDFAGEVFEIAQSLRIPAEGRGEGRVVALDVHDALQTSFDYVFVLGLTEGMFPLQRRLDPLISDEQRDALAKAGVGIRPRGQAQDEEAYLFHLAVSTARKRLYLCYPDTDVGGEPTLRSFYVDEVERLVPTADRIEMRLRDVVPSLYDASSPREVMARALHLEHDNIQAPDAPHAREALQALSRARVFISTGATTMTERLALAEHGARVERIRDGRAEKATWEGGETVALGSYDGVLMDEHVLGRLARRFGPKHVFSASQLTRYGQCPMAFFFERVLGLEELPEPGVEVTVLEQGQLIHRILSQFYQARPKIGGGYLHVAGDAQDNGPSPEARELLFRTTDEILKSFERRAFACQETLWQVTAELVRSRLETWLDAEVQIPSKLKLAPGEIPVPVRFEFSYGKGGMQPLVLELPNAGRIAVAGRIDRVDEIGADGFVVYDYKRKSAPEKKQILEGEDFQLIFYALAAQRLIFQERRQCKAFAYVRVGYPVSDALRAKVTDREEIEELIKRSLEHVDSHVSKMRSGRFHWAPRSCPSSTRSSCPFAYVCRYDMQRVRRRETETRPGGEEDE